MLKRISVGHYKSLADVNLSFGKSNVIVGPNGSGKSNLIDCINFVRDAALEDLDSASTKRHGAESVRQWSRSRPYDVTIELDFESSRGQGSYKCVLSSASGQFRVKEESGNWHQNRNAENSNEDIRKSSFHRYTSGKVDINTTPVRDRPDRPTRAIVVPAYELFLSQLTSSSFNLYSMSFQHLVHEITNLSTYAIYPNIMRVPQVVSRENTLTNDGSNLSSVIKKLNSGHRRLKNRLIEALRVILPIVNDIQIRSAGGFYVPILRVNEPNGDVHDFNMSQLSDGTLRMIGLLAAFYQFNSPTCIALEEPEQMIHPGVLPILKDAADDYLTFRDNNQYFITTHSPNFLNLFAPEDITWMSFDKGITKASKINSRRMALIHEQLLSPGEMLVREGVGL